MTEEKRKRLVVAGTVGAVLLVVILMFVMVFQLISLQIRKNAYNELQAEIARYEQLIENGQDTLEARSKKNWIERRARELGYVYPSDVELG